MVRPDAAHEKRVAVHEQVVRRDGGGDVGAGHFDVLHGIARRDVLEHHLELREALDERSERLLDERLLAVEDINRRIGRLAVHQQRHAELLHLLERMEAARDARHTGIRMRRGAGRVELHRAHMARQLGARDLISRGVVGQIERHQRLELGVVGQLAENAIAIVQRLRRGRDRRLEVRHDDGAREAPRRIGEHRGHRRPVAQMHVEVVRALQRDAIHYRRFYLAPPVRLFSDLR